MTDRSEPESHLLPDLASRALGGSVDVGQRRAVRRAREPHQRRPRRRSRRTRSGTRARSWTGGSRAGAAQAGQRRGDRAARRRRASCAASSSTPRTSPATTRPRSRSRRCAVDGYPDGPQPAPGEWTTLVARSADQRRHPERVQRRRPAPVHPRQTDHLPRRRRRPAAGARRRGARPAAAAGGLRPGRARERRPGHRREQRVLLLARQPDHARQRARHGRRLGDQPAPRRRQRLGRRRRSPAPATVQIAELDTSLLRRQRPGLGPAHRRRTGASCCRAPRCCPTPGTASSCAESAPAERVRLDIYPDGGMARLRLIGAPTEAGTGRARARSFLRRAARAAAPADASGTAGMTARSAWLDELNADAGTPDCSPSCMPAAPRRSWRRRRPGRPSVRRRRRRCSRSPTPRSLALDDDRPGRRRWPRTRASASAGPSEPRRGGLVAAGAGRAWARPTRALREQIGRRQPALRGSSSARSTSSAPPACRPTELLAICLERLGNDAATERGSCSASWPRSPGSGWAGCCTDRSQSDGRDEPCRPTCSTPVTGRPAAGVRVAPRDRHR